MAKLKKVNWKSKKTWKNILVIGLAIITLVGAIVGLSALFRKSEETTKEINPTYAIGGLTEQGAYLETKESIYTKDAFECYGLKTSLEFDNNISYRLYFYNENNAFIESTSKLTDAFDSSKTNMPEETKYCRIVITPNEDSKISWYEKSSYANQLAIKVNKDQTKSDGVFIPVNLFEIDSSHIGYIRNASATSSGSTTSYKVFEGFGVTKPISVVGVTQLKFVYSEEFKSRELTYFFEDGEDVLVKWGTSISGQTEIVVDVPSGAKCLYVNYALGEEFSIYAIA